MKLTIHMAMGSNEQGVVEIPLKDLQDWDAKVAPVLKRLEQRVGDRARRIIEGNKQMQELRKKDPIMANTCHNIILVCLGQMVTVDSTGLVEKDWQAPQEAQLAVSEAQ